jgi:hypothetical protein
VRYLTVELERARTVPGGAINLALNKPATQSSIDVWSTGQTCDEDARGANNGNLREAESYGFHTAWELDPWWQVDLVDAANIEEIRLYNRRGETAFRLRHFTLLQSNDGITWQEFFRKIDDTVFDEAPYVVRLAPWLRTRFVRVRLDGEEFLHFDQCMIYGYHLAIETETQ